MYRNKNNINDGGVSKLENVKPFDANKNFISTAAWSLDDMA